MKRRQVFIEDEDWEKAREKSKKYYACTNSKVGSSSWYTRQALIEKLAKEK